MALKKILDDYVLKFYEIFPKIPGKINKEDTVYITTSTLMDYERIIEWLNVNAEVS